MELMTSFVSPVDISRTIFCNEQVHFGTELMYVYNKSTSYKLHRCLCFTSSKNLGQEYKVETYLSEGTSLLCYIGDTANPKCNNKSAFFLAKRPLTNIAVLWRILPDWHTVAMGM